jgi:cobalt/nickel transport system permease protein
LLFGDGGVYALGANFINMGLIGALGGYAIYAPIRRAIGGRGGVLIGAMAAAWFAVILASGAFAIELAASGRWSDFPSILGWMALVHAAIGLGEALITGLVLRFLLLTRPDLIPDAEPGRAAGRWGQAALAGLGIALALAVFLAPFASERPDGLEYVGEKLGFIQDGSRPVMAAPWSDYQLPGLGQAPALATATAGGLGTLIVFAAGIVLARAVTRPLTEGIGPDAA